MDLLSTTVQHTFGRALTKAFGRDAIREITSEANDGTHDSLTEYSGSPDILVRRPTAFLPAHARPYDPSFYCSPFSDRSALVDTVYYPLPRLLDRLLSASSGQGHNANEILNQAVEVFRQVTGVDVLRHGCNIGARSRYQPLPAFRFSMRLRFDESTPMVSIQPIAPLRIPSANSCYRADLCLRTNGVLVFEARAQMHPILGVQFLVPKNKGPVDEIEIRAYLETPDGAVFRIWEFIAPLIRTMQINMGVGGTTTREVPSRYDSISSKRESVLRPLFETMPVQVRGNDRDPWVDWERAIQRMLTDRFDKSLNQNYFAKDRRKDFAEWVRRRFGGIKEFTVVDPYFDLQGAADFYDVSNEASITLDVVTTVECLGQPADPEAAMRDHAKRVILASSSKASSVRYLTGNSFHDRYVSFKRDGESVVLSLSNSWNGTVNHFDLFVQELNPINALSVLQTIEELKSRAKTVIRSEDFAQLFENRRRYAKPDEPPSDQASAAWERVLSVAQQSEHAADGGQLAQSLRLIGAADYYGVRRIDKASLAQIFAALEHLERSAVAQAAAHIVDALEQDRRRFEGGERRLTGQVFKRRTNDASYWMDRIGAWEAAFTNAFHASEAGWNRADLLALSMLLNTHGDAVVEILEQKKVFEELVAFAWGIGFMEFGPDLELRGTAWPLPRLASCWWRFDKLQFPPNGAELTPESFFRGLNRIKNELPASDAAVFLAHADRRLSSLRDTKRRISGRDLGGSFVADWEKASLDRLFGMSNDLRDIYVLHRFGPFFDRDPEGLVKFVNRCDGAQGINVLGNALSHAMASDTKTSGRLLAALKISHTSPVNERDLSNIPWLKNEHANCFSHLCMLLSKAGAPSSGDLSEVMVSVTKAMRFPLGAYLGTGDREDKGRHVPHLFVIINVLAYRSLDGSGDADEIIKGLPQHVRDRLSSLIISAVRHATDLWPHAAFLILDAAALVLGSDLLAVERHMLRPEHRALLLSAFAERLPELETEYRRLTVLGDEVDTLSFVTSVVYAAFVCRRLSKTDEVKTTLIQAIGELQRVVQSGEELSGLVALAVEVMESPHNEVVFIKLRKALGSHMTFGVLRALAKSSRPIN